MGFKFNQLKKLWLLYLFLLFFAFFMFALSINVYLVNLYGFNNQEPVRPRRHRVWPAKSVVAHYIGKGDIFANMTADDYNINQFNPIESEGAGGRPILIPPRDSFRMQRFFKLNSFNILASDRIPLNRTLKDYRNSECRKITYPTDLPNTSVVIIFHNEAWSVLLRTITSVINRTPRKLLREIILVDDASDRTYLKKQLENYIKTLSVPTRLVRQKNRSGIVAARVLGAKVAKGDVLTFLDSHCECTRGWLEPLLLRIQESRATVVCPNIDTISDDNFGYTKVYEGIWGVFNWELTFKWYQTQRKGIDYNDRTKPIPTPGMAGGLFAIDRMYFFEMGAYDEDMKCWGGENSEMSFRIWQCGGRIEISPCSHVGHIFRKQMPYHYPDDILKVLRENLARTALVWLDDWKYFGAFYSGDASLSAFQNLNVSKRLEVRKKLHCKPFSWYLQYVWPEHFYPADDRFFGRIVWLDGQTEFTQAYTKYMKNLPGRLLSREWPSTFEVIQKAEEFAALLDVDRDKCLLLKSNDTNPSSQRVIVNECSFQPDHTGIFVITPKGQIMTNNNLCLCYVAPKVGFISSLRSRKTTSSNIQMCGCDNEPRQLWRYDMDTQHLSHYETKFCLTLKAAMSVRTEHLENVVMALECDYKDITQKWGLVPLPWKTLMTH